MLTLKSSAADDVVTVVITRKCWLQWDLLGSEKYSDLFITEIQQSACMEWNPRYIRSIAVLVMVQFVNKHICGLYELDAQLVRVGIVLVQWRAFWNLDPKCGQGIARWFSLTVVMRNCEEGCKQQVWAEDIMFLVPHFSIWWVII